MNTNMYFLETAPQTDLLLEARKLDMLQQNLLMRMIISEGFGNSDVLKTQLTELRINESIPRIMEFIQKYQKKLETIFKTYLFNNPNARDTDQTEFDEFKKFSTDLLATLTDYWNRHSTSIRENGCPDHTFTFRRNCPECQQFPKGI